MKLILFFSMIFIALLLISGCSVPRENQLAAGEDSEAAPEDGLAIEGESAAVEGDNFILIDDFAFAPQELVIGAGTMVTWKQNHKVVHTVVSQGLFESEVLNLGDAFTFTFTEPGEYEYYCSLHPSMRGKVIVR